MDLSVANDHPARLLGVTAANAKHASQQEGASISGALSLATQSVWYERAAIALMEYEDDNGITFAALNNNALDTLREVFNRKTTDTHEDMSRYVDLERAIADLLGLGD